MTPRCLRLWSPIALLRPLKMMLNLHRNLQPNVESRLQQSLLQPVHPSLSLMGNMCSCSRLCGTVRGSFTLSLCRTRGMHRTDEWMLCIENSAYLYCVHGMTGHEFCRVCAGKWFVGSGVHPPGGGGGDRRPWGGAGHGGARVRTICATL